MFDNLDKTFKSRVAIGSCVIAFGIFIYKTHPFAGFANDWGYFPKVSWLPPSMRSTDGTDTTGVTDTTSATGAGVTGADVTDTTDTDAAID